MSTNDRYWAYIHETDGFLNVDLGNHEVLGDAIDAVLEEMKHHMDYWYDGNVGRVVDTHLDYGTTVWVAGAGHTIAPVVDGRNPYADEDGFPVRIDGIEPPAPRCDGTRDDRCEQDLGKCPACGYIIHDVPQDADVAHDSLCCWQADPAKCFGDACATHDRYDRLLGVSVTVLGSGRILQLGDDDYSRSMTRDDMDPESSIRPLLID
jgi:hypothetical protein